MKKRVLSILTALALCLSLLPTVALAEGGVSYLDAAGKTQTCTTATEVTSSDTEWTTGWYVVQGDVTIGTVTASSRIEVSGDVHLILADGCNFTVYGGIQVQDNDNDPNNGSPNALTIYAQSIGEETMGKLTARVENGHDAAIGGNGGDEVTITGGSGGTITINGGVVKTKGIDGAGIGGGGGGTNGAGIGGSGGNIIITGGSVDVSSHTGAGIGGGGGNGGSGGSGGNIIITGGRVDAQSQSGAGIGGGYGFSEQGSSGIGDGGTLIITGGTITPTLVTGLPKGYNGSAYIIPDGDSSLKAVGTLTLPVDLTIPRDKTLTIGEGQTLTIPAGVTLTIAEGGALTNNGTIIKFGTLTNNGTFTGSQPKINTMYLDANGGEQTAVCAAITADNIDTYDTLTAGWYVVQGTVEIGSRVTVSGDVHLILADGCTLTVNGGIQVQDNSDATTNTPNTNALTIYAQSTDESTMGELIAKGAERDNNAVIGGNGGNSYGGSCGTIIINGGTVTATSTGYGAAIGGGYGDTGGSGGKITINGGNINASNQIGAGIGGGEGGGDGGSGGEITINGGSVIATGVNGAGIGGGQGDGGDQGGGSGGTITINGGSVIATGVNGAAIGGGYSGGGTGGDGGTITITGGSVIATGNDNGAGIGGGCGTLGGSGGEVMITGGTVKASSSRGAGIGGGSYDVTSGTDGTFQTTNNGNAVIFASSIGDQSHKDDWSGIIFEGNEGEVYGNPTLADDLTIPENKALDIPSGKTLTVNSTITVQGTLTNNGTIFGSGSIMPEGKRLAYKAFPSAPVIASVSADSITLRPITGETAVEYSKDNTNWQSETTFSGLTAATSYTFYARYQENGFYKDPSPQSVSNPAYTAYAAPVTNEGYSIDYAAETITVSDGYEVNTDSGLGTGTVVTSGSTVTPGQTFHVRKAASGDIPASEGTEFTIPARPDAPAAPTVKSKTSGSVTLEVILGAQYSMDGGATWQDSPEFTGLSASTAYRFVARYGATESRFASLASAELNVTTNAAPFSGSVSTYAITVESAKNGAVTVAPKTAAKGDIVTLTVEPDKGYTLETLTVTDKNGDEIALTNKGDGKYTFKMPGSKVTVKATFMEDNSMLNFFVDVPADAYYYDAVLWAAKNGITGGVDDTHFAPNATCTRAQIVTFLWRAAGSPVVNYAMNFSDVPADAYYAEAVRWAVSQGITKGTSDTTFSPDATCTRAQAMTFLYRSEQAQGGGMQGAWMFQNPFSDVDLENYYGEAVMWAVANGVTGGTTATTFSPNATCTRAQIVTFLFRCLGE